MRKSKIANAANGVNPVYPNEESSASIKRTYRDILMPNEMGKENGVEYTYNCIAEWIRQKTGEITDPNWEYGKAPCSIRGEIVESNPILLIRGIPVNILVRDVVCDNEDTKSLFIKLLCYAFEPNIEVTDIGTVNNTATGILDVYIELRRRKSMLDVFSFN